ncbi:hypothetical protein C8R48DRAFT_750300 [Suillus tomentosus]|nr:hypothetical protein C8R48DRAFT_750300 [Suillus tomentosus]
MVLECVKRLYIHFGCYWIGLQSGSQDEHCTHKCRSLKNAKDCRKKGRKSANKASEASKSLSPASTPLPTTPTSTSDSTTAQNTSQSIQQVTKFAGNASLRTFDLSHPLCPLQLDAHADWNADTGATSHMTPHRHWLRNYAPKRIPIKLADNNIVYSAGEGTVVFSPVVNGQHVRAVEFTRVLHTSTCGTGDSPTIT